VTAVSNSTSINMTNIRRNPASAIKPLLVYAPALNENIISPETQILDDEMHIDGYHPQNVDKAYHGYVSATEALAKSYNIPAIKTLSYVGIDRAKNYVQKMGISFDENDTGYALALGGMTYGTSLDSLVGGYMTLADGGKYTKPQFISHIATFDGRIVYRRNMQKSQVFREDSAYLATKMLTETAKTGTAKKLKNLGIEIASKTGTFGKNGKNFDAYNISYTPTQTIGIWCGNLDNSPISVVGGNQPTRAVLNFFEGEKNEPFAAPSSVTECEIDTRALAENHRVVCASKFVPARYKRKSTFSRFNLPETE